MRRIADTPLWGAAAAVMMLSCTWVGQGEASVALRHYGLPLGIIGAAVLFAPRLPGPRMLAGKAAAGLPALCLFILLIGAGGMVSHGSHFAAMADDFWHADLLRAPDRRPFLSAIVYLLPPWPAPYWIVWYVVFCAFFLVAWTHLGARAIAPLQRFALLTASIAAYLLILPGYTEVLTFLVALLCWRAKLSAGEKCMAGAAMIGGHEIAAGFALLFLAIEAEGKDRKAWLAVLAFLYAVYAAGYVLAAGSAFSHMLNAAARPDARYPLTAFQLVLLHPWRCVLGIAIAYKIAWLLLPAGLYDTPRTRLHAGCVVLALPLVLVASDTSRMVQFGSLSMLAVASAVWPGLSRWAGTAMTYGLLVIPSICVGSNGIPAWGKGLYAVYLLAAQSFGLVLGSIVF